MLLALDGLVGLKGFLATDLTSIGDQLPGARVLLAQTMHWLSEFDARLLGCPTIIIQQH